MERAAFHLVAKARSSAALGTLVRPFERWPIQGSWIRRGEGRPSMMRRVTSRERPADRGRRICRAAAHRLADDGRRARTGTGLSQREVGRAIDASHARVGRFERGDVAFPSLEFLGAYCAVVGLDLSLRAYPAGDAIRDIGQQRLLERFRARLHPSLGWATEAPLPIAGDRRAWDALVRGADWRLAVEAETVIDDVQAVERRLTLKRRDGGMDHVILLVADTRRNRRVLASVPGAFAEWPLRTREILHALARGEDPGGSGIVIL
jgi:transcriptional regulator with XRE-family HTH domain